MEYFFRNLYKIIIGVFVFYGLGMSAQSVEIQTKDSLLILQKRLNKVETYRIKDSLKIDLLTQELKGFITAQKTTVGNKIENDSLLLQQKKEIELLRTKTEGIPVVLFRDTLFLVYTSLGPYQADERVAAIQKKIQNLYERPFFYPDSVVVRSSYNLSSISYQNEIISGISLSDALWTGKDIDSLAIEQAGIIREVVSKYRKENSLRNNLFRIAELFTIIIAVVIIILLINGFFKYIRKKFLSAETQFLSGIKIRNYQLLKKEHILGLLNKLIDLLRIFIILIVFILLVPLALSIFPSTQNWSEFINEWIWAPLKSIAVSIVHYLPNLIYIVIILFIARYVLRLMRFFALEIERGVLTIRGFHPEWGRPTYVLARFVFLMIILVIIFPYLPGSGSDAFKGISVFLGILISIGSSSAVANAVAGLVITYMRPFQVNDWIKTGEVTGIVIEKNALVTRLRTINNEDISVPNSAVLSGHTVNYSSIGKSEGLILTTKVKIRYDYSPVLIEELLIRAALQTKDITEKFKPYIFQLSLEEIHAVYELNAYTFAPQNMYFIKSDLVKNIQTIFAEAKVEISSTQYVEIKRG